MAYCLSQVQPQITAMSPDIRKSLIEVRDAPEEGINLAQACLLLASSQQPGLDTAAYLQKLDGMAAEVRGRLPADASVTHTLRSLNHYLFAEQGFHSNTHDYNDPRNHYLNHVLDRRTGIQISLSVVYLELARRLGLPLEGVSFPGHFLVKLELEQGLIVLDPFHGGASLNREELELRLRQVYADEDVGDEHLAYALQTADKRAILVRMLRNLKGLHLRQQDPERALEHLDMLLTLAPGQATELLERAALYESMECHHAALRDYEQYLSLYPHAGEADAVRERVLELRPRARLH